MVYLKRFNAKGKKKKRRRVIRWYSSVSKTKPQKVLAWDRRCAWSSGKCLVIWSSKPSSIWRRALRYNLKSLFLTIDCWAYSSLYRKLKWGKGLQFEPARKIMGEGVVMSRRQFWNMAIWSHHCNSCATWSLCLYAGSFVLDTLVNSNLLGTGLYLPGVWTKPQFQKVEAFSSDEHRSCVADLGGFLFF